ncbi:MAG: ATP-binding protein [Acidilobaceae archaeon]
MGFSGVYGYVVRSTSSRVSFVASDAPLPLGEYVELHYKVHSRVSGLLGEQGGGERVALAVVSNASYEHAVPQSVMSYLGPRAGGVESLKLSHTTLYVVAELSGGRAEPPRYPIPPDTPVRPASGDTLSRVYGGFTGGVKLGLLAPRSLGVEVRVNPDKLAKHLLIAGATGSGKSNTVAILADRLSAVGAPVVVFDVHGEYSLEPEDGDLSRVQIVEACINPLRMDPRILAAIVIPEPQARRQRRLLAKAMNGISEELKKLSAKEGLSLVTALQELVERRVKPDSAEEEAVDQESQLIKGLRNLLVAEAKKVGGQEERVVDRVVEKVEEFFEVTPLTVTGELPTTHISPGRMLVVDASTLGDEQKRWVLKIMVDEILEKLKTGHLGSTVLVVEEAPLFIGVDVGHPVKQSLQRFAREGRKFGGCLIVVSQRPRSLDVNVVSQLQNFVFLRMVQEEDIKAVMNIADSLDENLAKTISSLPDGRAIVMGEWLGRFPAIVDIDLHKGKRIGATPPLTDIWARGRALTQKPQFSLEL